MKAEILEEVKKEIEKMLSAGFIRPCRYAEWISSIVPVEKKDGRWRVAIDFRDLNRATPKDEYPMPVAETLLNATAGHKVLSFMDGNAGYNQIFMAPEDIHKTAFRVPGSVGLFEYPVTYEDLTEELKKKYDEVKAILETDLIGSFQRTRSHGIRWKGFSPEGALDGVDMSAPSEERTRSLRQEINFMVAHSLHRHSESLVNTLERVALRVIQEITRHQYSPSGPALGTHQGEIPLQSRPPLPFALAAPEVPSSPAYVIYKIGGDPSDYQFLYEAPKEIPHGYTCTYVPMQNRALTNQTATQGLGTAGGTSEQILRSTWLAKYATPTNLQSSTPAAGSELEKQAWLAKYATPANLRVRLLQPAPRIRSYNLERPVRHGAEKEGNRLFQAVPQRVRFDPTTTQIKAP
ncbi:hypothetical protein QYE76_001749 [Lolium multiflorum]|uniref:Reverse transcriptase domain-containing protein n=1 Tax=Lolium multiflorum TaxID=4521 RepID=A0AAD8RLR7_LOLMU|nr:hypothetical protein QYE76_001749 [Lolium multiflorum]